jgi:hypothetical protein
MLMTSQISLFAQWFHSTVVLIVLPFPTQIPAKLYSYLHFMVLASANIRQRRNSSARMPGECSLQTSSKNWDPD